ncbi:hypothetical protein OFL77_27860, partial [Escherichia coli]|uniref:hypothetical protein n=1 Tax=Escherichia coli TaxID=562 RepID=UPI0021DFF342
NQHTMLTEEPYIVNAMKDSIANDLCLAANGVRYTKKQISLYSELLAVVFGNRIAFKKRAKVAKSKIETLKAKEQTP